MNPVYSIMEHRHRWFILAGISFLVGIVGAIAMLAYVVPHPVARAWLILWLVITAAFLVLKFLEWKRLLEEQVRAAEEQPNRTVRTIGD